MILEQVLYELVNTGYNKKLIAGVVLTGGGAKIKDIDRFTEYILGLDARVGTPQEHLSGTITEEMKHPMHATGIGLVLKAIQDIEEEKKLHPIKEEKIEEVKENVDQQVNNDEDKIDLVDIIAKTIPIIHNSVRYFGHFLLLLLDIYTASKYKKSKSINIRKFLILGIFFCLLNIF